MKYRVLNSYTSKRSLPRNLIDKDFNLFSHELSREIKSTHYLIEKNVTVAKTFIVKFFPIKIFTKYVYFYRPKLIKIIKDFVKNIIFIQKSEKERIDITPLWITDNKTSVYFHFLCDALGRYFLLENDTKEKNITVIIPKKYEIGWIVEILNYLKINFLVLEETKSYQFKKIYIPNYPAPSGNFHKENILKIREAFIKALPENLYSSSPIRKVWVSRSKARRPVKNYIEIKNFLIDRGFEIVNLEDLSSADKVKLMSETKILAGLHGSGLTNVLFMNKDTYLLDIRDPQDNIKNAFFSLASEVEVNYYYFERENIEDYIISKSKLENAINQIEEKINNEK